jgi:hypothetical protein
MHTKILVGKPEGKRPQRKPRHMWEDNVELVLGKYGCKVYTGCI